jgi:hypothetical protein
MVARLYGLLANLMGWNATETVLYLDLTQVRSSLEIRSDAHRSLQGPGERIPWVGLKLW